MPGLPERGWAGAGAGAQHPTGSRPGAGRCTGKPTRSVPENVVNRHPVPWLFRFCMIAVS